MDNNTSSTYEDLKEQSLLSINRLWLSFGDMLVFETINTILCSICVYILTVGKPFQGNKAFILIRAMFLSDMLAAFYEFLYAGWHVSNYVRQVPEIMTVGTCFWITSPQVFILMNIACIDFAIAFDRFFIVYDPNNHRALETSFFYRMIVASICFSAAAWLCVCLEPIDRGSVLIFCSLRISLGPIAQYGFWLVLLVINVGTVSMYVAAAVVTKIKVNIGINVRQLEKT